MASTAEQGRREALHRTVRDPMNTILRRTLVKRLALAALVMSLLAGSFVYYHEMDQIDDQVVLLAIEEARSLVEHADILSVRERSDYRFLVRQLEAHVRVEHLAKRHFILIELYDEKKQKVFEVVDPAYADVVRDLTRERHEFLLSGGVDYRTMKRGDDLFIQVFTPVKAASSNGAAYFEGLYHVRPDLLEHLPARIWMSVLQVIFIVIAVAIALYPVILSLTRDAIRLADDLADANLGMLDVLGSAVAKRDLDTSAHNRRVTIYAVQLAETLGLAPKAIQGLIKGAFLHDVGKIGVTDTILLKASGLNDEETNTMRSHVRHGKDIVERYAWLRDALDVILYHHEHFDGAGYPDGIAGKDIPVTARIFALVDVFDALTTKRHYRDPASLDDALRIMQLERGKQFDPEVFDVFLKMAPRLYRDVFLADQGTLDRLLADIVARYLHAR